MILGSDILSENLYLGDKTFYFTILCELRKDRHDGRSLRSNHKKKILLLAELFFKRLETSLKSCEIMETVFVLALQASRTVYLLNPIVFAILIKE
jgi:hypothetical protein